MNEMKCLPDEIQIWYCGQWKDHIKGIISNLFNYLADHLDNYIALIKILASKNYKYIINIDLFLLKKNHKSTNWSKPANEKINDINIFIHLEAVLWHLEI